MFAADIFIWATEQHQGSSQVTNKWFLLFSTSAFGGPGCPNHCWINPFTPIFCYSAWEGHDWGKFFRLFQFFKALPHFTKRFGPLVGWFRMGAILILFMFIKQCSISLQVLTFCCFGPLHNGSLTTKHTEKLKKIISRYVLENSPEKASIYAILHRKLIGCL